MSKINTTRLRILVSGLPTKAAHPVGEEVLRWMQALVPELGDPLHQKLRWEVYHRVRVAVEEVLGPIRAGLEDGLADYLVEGDDEDRTEGCSECGGPMLPDGEFHPFCTRGCRASWDQKAAAFKREGSA
jgi:hypothetical protein